MGRRSLPGPAISPIRRTIRYWLARIVVSILVRSWVRLRSEGRGSLPAGPAIYCFNHLSWADPFVLMAVLPYRPRLYFFGPKEQDLRVGGRNRIMYWTGTAIPYKPGKDDLLEATRRVTTVVEAGGVVAIAGEGRIGTQESSLLPLSEGAAYFALRCGVPLVPIAVNGTSWLRFGGRVRVRVGEPIPAEGRPNRAAVETLTTRLVAALRLLVADALDVGRPGPFGRWLTEQFNEWPEGSREAAAAAAAPAAPATDQPPGA